MPTDMIKQPNNLICIRQVIVNVKFRLFTFYGSWEHWIRHMCIASPYIIRQSIFMCAAHPLKY